MNAIGWVLTGVSALLLGCGLASISQHEMSEGERLFRSNCRSCHTLPDPTEYSDEEWPELVKRYADRIELPMEAQRAILEYLQTVNAR